MKAMEWESRSAVRYAQTLQRLLELPALPLPEHFDAPATAWAGCGLMALTGTAEGPPLLAPAPIPSCADAVIAVLRALAPGGALDTLNGASLLAERAALAGLQRQGLASPGGACRLLQAQDQWLVVNLPRAEDWALLPAWLECEGQPEGWEALAAALARRDAASLLARGRELGLAVAAATDCEHMRPACEVLLQGRARATRTRRPRVIDLSSLWAGPLCGALLHSLGAEVVKVESISRPDGARAGPPAFFHLLNAGKASVALDFRSDWGRRQLRALIAEADIVIEASRPRALYQLGIDAAALVREQAGLTWVSLTGYGRGEPEAQWVAYGDDAGAAAGLNALMAEAVGQPYFVGDALADPLTGLHAALAAWVSDLQGGGRLLALSLCGVVQQVLRHDALASAQERRERQQHWTAQAHACGISLPRSRPVTEVAAALGADTAAVFKAWGLAC